MDKQQFLPTIEQICEEKAISKEKVIETIEMALAAAYKKEYGAKGQNIKVKFDPETGAMKVSQVKLVVDESMLKEESDITENKEESEEETSQKENSVEDDLERKIRFNAEKHIMIDEVKKLDSKSAFTPKGKKLTDKIKEKIKPRDEIEFPLKARHDFGRIAAQTAKQVILQRIREAEREAVYDEYKGKEGQVASGIIQRIEGRNIFVDIGKTTGIMFPEEQLPRERYRIGQRLKFYIAEVQKDSRGPNIILSRTHPKLISQLFALEVPEISAGTVEIKAIAREAGARSKIAVSSKEERVDPIGSMIGQKGTRVQTVISELGGEKIDIIEWSQEPAKFIAAALSPAKTIDVEIDEKTKQAKAIVPEDQLSLAIGIKGQNVRLAAKLTGWRIDVSSPQSEPEKEKEKEKILVKKKKIIKKKAKKE